MSHLCQLLILSSIFIAFCSIVSDCFPYFSANDSHFLCWFHFLLFSMQTFFMVLFMALFSCLHMLIISPNSFLHISPVANSCYHDHDIHSPSVSLSSLGWQENRPGLYSVDKHHCLHDEFWHFRGQGCDVTSRRDSQEWTLIKIYISCLNKLQTSGRTLYYIHSIKQSAWHIVGAKK